MRKTMEQIVLEGQVAKCRSIEELYVLWELMQQMEEDPFGNTCYPELDQRNFHVDGIADPEHYDGTLYILKETNMRKMIQKGETMPVVSDIRADFLSGKSPSGRVEYLDYLTSMQKILWEEKHPGEECRLPGKKLREKAAVLYINKRGGKGAADEISMDYGQYYIEFIKKQIRLLNPKTVVCCGEDLFRLIVMEVFQNKKQKKNLQRIIAAVILVLILKLLPQFPTPVELALYCIPTGEGNKEGRGRGPGRADVESVISGK